MAILVPEWHISRPLRHVPIPLVVIIALHAIGFVAELVLGGPTLIDGTA